MTLGLRLTWIFSTTMLEEEGRQAVEMWREKVTGLHSLSTLKSLSSLPALYPGCRIVLQT